VHFNSASISRLVTHAIVSILGCKYPLRTQAASPARNEPLKEESSVSMPVDAARVGIYGGAK